MNTTRGLRCEIFRSSLLGDCSAGGISSRVASVTLVDANGPFEPDETAPAVRLVRRKIYGKDYVHAEPVEPCPSGASRMAGGTFIFTSDSRFRDAVGFAQPVSLHDRHEFADGGGR